MFFDRTDPSAFRKAFSLSHKETLHNQPNNFPRRQNILPQFPRPPDHCHPAKPSSKLAQY